MASRQANSRVRVASADTSPTLSAPAQVGLPTDTGGAGETAQALQAALGLAGQYVGTKAAIDRDAGTLAAQQGQVDEETLRQQEQNAEWVLGAEKVLGQSRAIQDEAQMKADFAAEVDPNASAGEAREWMNEWMAARYEGADPGIGQVAAPFLARGADDILGQHTQTQAENTKQEVRHGLSVNTDEWLRREDKTPEEWAEVREEYTDLYRSKSEGLVALANDMAAAVRANGSDLLLQDPMFEKMKTNPATRDIIDRALSEGKAARTKEWTRTNQIEVGEHIARVNQAAEAGNLASFQQLLIEGNTPNDAGVVMMSQAQTTAAISAFYKQSLTDQTMPVMIEKFLTGTAGIPSDDIDEVLAASEAALVEQGMAPEQIEDTLIARAVQAGALPEKYNDILDRANPANPDSMAAANDVYARMVEVDPTYPQYHLKEKQRQKMEQWQSLRRHYTDEEAAEQMKLQDASIYDGYKREDVNNALDDAINEVTDIPWSWNEIQRTPQLNRMVQDRIRYFASFPGNTLEQASELAVADIQTRTQIVEGVLFNSNSPWGEEGDAVARLELDRLEEFHDTPYEIVAHPNNPKMVFLKPQDALFGEVTDAVHIEDLVRSHKAEQKRIREEAAAQENANMKASIVEEAKSRAFPEMKAVNSFAPKEADTRAQRDAAWDALPEADKKGMYDAIEEEFRVEQEIRDAQAKRNVETLMDLSIN